MSRYKVILLDVDGVLCLGRECIEGAPGAVVELKSAGYRIRVVSNNSGLGSTAMAEKLRNFGLPIEPDEMILATRLLARKIAEETARATVYLIGSQGLQQDLEMAGLRVLREPEEVEYLCDYLVVGADPKIDYLKLTRALRVLLKGGRFVAVNSDGVYPTEKGPVPGAGAIVGAVQGMVGRSPDLVVGKPNPHLLTAAAESCGVPASACLMVGDTAATDLIAARAAGTRCVLVETGNGGQEDPEIDERPDATIPSILHLQELLAGEFGRAR